jgi:hypothetical protein
LAYSPSPTITSTHGYHLGAERLFVLLGRIAEQFLEVRFLEISLQRVDARNAKKRGVKQRGVKQRIDDIECRNVRIPTTVGNAVQKLRQRKYSADILLKLAQPPA